jgi:hypothetical protein
MTPYGCVYFSRAESLSGVLRKVASFLNVLERGTDLSHRSHGSEPSGKLTARDGALRRRPHEYANGSACPCPYPTTISTGRHQDTIGNYSNPMRTQTSPYRFSSGRARHLALASVMAPALCARNSNRSRVVRFVNDALPRQLDWFGFRPGTIRPLSGCGGGSL